MFIWRDTWDAAQALIQSKERDIEELHQMRKYDGTRIVHLIQDKKALSAELDAAEKELEPLRRRITEAKQQYAAEVKTNYELACYVKMLEDDVKRLEQDLLRAQHRERSLEDKLHREFAKPADLRPEPLENE